MKHSLDAHIITNTTSILDWIESNVPSKLDSTVWANQYDIGRGIDIDGNNYISLMIRFNNIPDRQVIMDKLQTKAQQVVGQLLTGSYLRLHTCDHDLEQRTGCVETYIWRK